MNRILLLILIGMLLFGQSASGNNAAAEPEINVDFTRDIQPILSDRCFNCHGPDAKAREADLRLDSREGLFGHGDVEPVVVPGKPNESTLLERVQSRDEDERMPPIDSGAALTPKQIELIRQWIKQGAKWSGHWSFQPILAQELPELKTTLKKHPPSGATSRTVSPKSLAEWSRGPIDRFVLDRQLRAGLLPAREASRPRLLRRVTLDLTGLPPTPEEVDAFVADRSPDAYERVVDRLLASPRYGERMAWDWLDAARYADSNGYQGDADRTMWPWRDWVINAMNDNQSFDRFTIEQLAGDLLPDATLQTKLATGFCRNHMINGEGGRIPEENRVEYIFDQIETVGTVWLGLTVTCIRCHDHKYDPLLQSEYYGLFDFFNQTPINGGGGNPQTPPVIAVATPLQQGRLDQLNATINAIAKTLKKLEATRFPHASGKTPGDSARVASLPEAIRKALRVSPFKRTVAQLTELEKQFTKTTSDSSESYPKQLGQLRAAIEQQDRLNKSLPRVMVMQDQSKPRESFILEKGLYNQRGKKVTAKVPAFLPKLASGAKVDRLALAQWLVDRSNPLSARVTVNRYWQAFFGIGLIKTPEDFGSQGRRPTHPMLIDHLAHTFMQDGWDVKRLHCRIVTSGTYRQSSATSVSISNQDPNNEWLARGPRFRLPSWMLRDQALAISGLLVEKVGGAAVYPYQPQGVWAEATFGKRKYKQDQGEKLYRRSLYTFWRRIAGPTIFFDSAKRQTCSVTLTRTNTPLHALTTLNDVTFVEAARVLAQRVMTDENSADKGRIEKAFRLATARRPTTSESDLLIRRLQTLRQYYTAHRKMAEQVVAIGEFPRDPALDKIEHAALTGVCLLILNLDETLTN